MQLPPVGGDGPYLVAAAVVYVVIEVSKFIHLKRNGAIPKMTDQLSELIRGQDKIQIRDVEFNKTLSKTLERIENKLERE